MQGPPVGHRLCGVVAAEAAPTVNNSAARQRTDPHARGGWHIVNYCESSARTRRRRRHSWVRRPARRCRQISLAAISELKVANLNVQGLNWTAHDHRFKMKSLIDEARRGQWHVAWLSELHSPDALAVVAVEEYVLVAGRRSGFLLSPVGLQAWEAGGWQHESHGDRICRMVLELRGQRIQALSAYWPTQGQTEERADVWETASSLAAHLPRRHWQWWGGDFNSHIGRQVGPVPDREGPHKLDTPTTTGGGELRLFMRDAALHLADSLQRVHKRGTWWHAQRGRWYENDVWVASEPVAKRLHGFTTFATPISDHRGKVARLTLATALSKRERQLLARPARDAKPAPRIAVEHMFGRASDGGSSALGAVPGGGRSSVRRDGATGHGARFVVRAGGGPLPGSCGGLRPQAGAHRPALPGGTRRGGRETNGRAAAVVGGTV